MTSDEPLNLPDNPHIRLIPGAKDVAEEYPHRVPLWNQPHFLAELEEGLKQLPYEAPLRAFAQRLGKLVPPVNTRKEAEALASFMEHHYYDLIKAVQADGKLDGNKLAAIAKKISPEQAAAINGPDNSRNLDRRTFLRNVGLLAGGGAAAIAFATIFNEIAFNKFQDSRTHPIITDDFADLAPEKVAIGRPLQPRGPAETRKDGALTIGEQQFENARTAGVITTALLAASAFIIMHLARESETTADHLKAAENHRVLQQFPGNLAEHVVEVNKMLEATLVKYRATVSRGDGARGA